MRMKKIEIIIERYPKGYRMTIGSIKYHYSQRGLMRVVAEAKMIGEILKSQGYETSLKKYDLTKDAFKKQNGKAFFSNKN